ncbi:uncharacterized protein LOC120089754 isoform X1 [Benincasa hispida]|uniref:uncharacterized protein LOC120089754 isoform X1 n=1 Tax=Benincasa hispida TaxID=102211 RepID=UPI00190195F4|nr:uncharacterized protein LOC120089754 isoform X1 [Benincasa hispida]
MKCNDPLSSREASCISSATPFSFPPVVSFSVPISSKVVPAIVKYIGNFFQRDQIGKDGSHQMEEQGKDTGMSNVLENEQSDTSIRGSEEMESNIACLLEKIESFTQLVSELLESGKTTFKDLSNEFEERIIAIHKDHVEKWQHEIKELRLLDSSNEEASTILCNARNLLQNGHIQF